MNSEPNSNFKLKTKSANTQIFDTPPKVASVSTGEMSAPGSMPFVSESSSMPSLVSMSAPGSIASQESMNAPSSIASQESMSTPISMSSLESFPYEPGSMSSLESFPSAPDSMSSLTMPSTSEPGSMPAEISSLDTISPMPAFVMPEKKKKRRTKKCKCTKKKGKSKARGRGSRSKNNRISQKKSLYEMYRNDGNSNFE
jgi:hypothetical protein